MYVTYVLIVACYFRKKEIQRLKSCLKLFYLHIIYKSDKPLSFDRIN